MRLKPLLLNLLLAFTLNAGAENGFESIFDGTLKDWKGDPTYWRAENGILTGEITPETLLKKNSFIIWKGGELADFELKLECRVSDHGNSGINYRSIQVPDPETKWAMEGYRCDIDGRDQWTGQNYEERGRTFLAYRGESVVLKPGAKPELARQLGDRAELQKQVKKNDWNEVHLILKGNHLRHFVNGVLMAEVLDEDAEKRRMTGLLGVQVHVGPPMKIEFRNIRVKKLDQTIGAATGTIKSSSYLVSINGMQLQPFELDRFKTACNDRLMDIHQKLETMKSSLQHMDPNDPLSELNPDSQTKLSAALHDFDQRMAALEESVHAVKQVELEIKTVSNHELDLRPGQVIQVIQSCPIIEVIQEDRPFANIEPGRELMLSNSRVTPEGMTENFSCFNVEVFEISNVNTEPSQAKE